MCGLLPNSAAMDCGKISIGDQIIEVNGVDMRQATVDEAADIMVRKLHTTQFHLCKHIPNFYNLQCIIQHCEIFQFLE